MENITEKMLVACAPVQGTYRKWVDMAQPHEISLIVQLVHFLEGQGDGKGDELEDKYHEYYRATMYGTINATLLHGSSTTEFQFCDADTYVNAGYGNCILIIKSMPEPGEMTAKVLGALPYIIANMYGLLPSMIIDMTQSIC